MSFKLHLILDVIRCNFPDISYLSETQKNNFQFLNDAFSVTHMAKPKRFHAKNMISKHFNVKR